MKKLYSSITKNEKIIVWIVIVFLIILLSLPFIYFYISSPEGYTWSGLHVLTPADYNHYFAYLEQVKQGHFLFKDHYTTEDQSRNILRPEWLIIGTIARIFSIENNILIFHIARSLLIIPFLWILYLFICYFFKSYKKRITALFFSIFASGLGGYTLFALNTKDCYSNDFFSCPMDLWTPEISVFLSLFNSPHLIYSLLLILLTILSIFLAWDRNKIRYVLYAAISANLLFVSHTFHLPTVLSVLGLILLYKIIKQKKLFIQEFKKFLLFIVFCLPSLLYVFYIFVFDYLAQIRASQNECLTTPILQTLISYGFLIPLAVIGIYFIIYKIKKLPEKFVYLIIWAVVHFALIYFPVQWQRRMTEGLSIVLCLLSVVAIFYLAAWLKRKYPKFFSFVNNNYLKITLFVILFGLSNIVVFASDFGSANDGKSSYFAYIPEHVFEGFDWLRNNANENGYVVSDQFLSSYLPAWTGLTVYAGHGIETINYQSKKKEVKLFFSDTSTMQNKLNFLEKNNLKYIFYFDYPSILKNEKPTYPGFLSNTKYFKKVFHQGETRIFEVINYNFQEEIKPGCGCN